MEPGERANEIVIVFDAFPVGLDVVSVRLPDELHEMYIFGKGVPVFCVQLPQLGVVITPPETVHVIVVL